MALINRLENSKFSLPGNGFNPQPGNPDWGHLAKGQSVLVSDRGFSNLHNQYSVYSLDNKENETTMVVKNYNKTPYQSYVPKETRLDPLDNNALKNRQSTSYIDKQGQKYSDKGPLEGRY
jgi:hypothetical protein